MKQSIFIRLSHPLTYLLTPSHLPSYPPFLALLPTFSHPLSLSLLTHPFLRPFPYPLPNLFPPPLGRYGSTPGLTSSDCSGLCEAGYFCPYGSTSSRQYPCGGPDVYCPTGSVGPIAAGGGRYTVVYIPTPTPTALPSIEPLVYAGTPTLCPKGYYCPNGHVRMTCPAGTFGAMTGLKSSSCSGKKQQQPSSPSFLTSIPM